MDCQRSLLATEYSAFELSPEGDFGSLQLKVISVTCASYKSVSSLLDAVSILMALALRRLFFHSMPTTKPSLRPWLSSQQPGSIEKDFT